MALWLAQGGDRLLFFYDSPPRVYATGASSEVRPASLAFSDSVPPSELGGTAACTLLSELTALAEGGAAGAVIAPLFLGPSDALRNGVSKARAALPAEFELLVGASIVDESDAADTRIARALAAQALRLARARRVRLPLKVLLVDHGTPSARVHAVRARLEQELRALLGTRAIAVGAASMERREGAEYDFNEPLLERALAAPPFDEGDVLLAMAFLLPGRHAGEGGDVETIARDAARDAAARGAALRVHMTAPLAATSLVQQVVADRVRRIEEVEERTVR